MELLIVNTAIVGLILLIYLSGVFLISQFKADNGIMDIAYGPVFFVSIVTAIYLTKTFNFLPLLLSGCIGLWALRLSFRIARKNIGKPEDERYAIWRKRWMKKGKVYFMVRSFIQINLLQGFIILMVSAPAILAFTFPQQFSLPFLIVGITIFAFGLSYEAIADWQLDRFIEAKKSGTETDNIMKGGLFKYSRRPNYFGETIVWWGLAIIVFPLPYGYLGIISPLLITYIVTKVTGPMLENIFLEKYPEEYSRYMSETNYLIPTFKTKAK